MLFHSHAFIFVFLPAVLLGVWGLTRANRHTATLLFLSVASLAFYGWWRWADLLVFAASILINYACAQLIEAQRNAMRPRPARGILIVGLLCNVALLGYYKYTDFFLTTLNAGVGSNWTLHHIVLPLGISFFTFEQITYLVDTYRGRCPAHGFIAYLAFLSFFPRLIAGPIVRPAQMLPQLTDPRTIRIDATTLSTGLFVFAIGLFKKLLLADTLATYVDPVFGQPGHVSFFDAWGAAIGFVLQIYFDFSAYSDMAIGVACMIGITLPENFDSPYKATSIIDFWRRWHMTLANFLRDYLYIPLGGNRSGSLRHATALMVTMVIAGLWHGANWTFVLFGAIHGVFLLVNVVWRRSMIPLPAGLPWAMTFVALATSFIVFRAPSIERAFVLVHDLVGGGGFGWDTAVYSVGRHEWKRMLPLLALVLLAPNRREMMAWTWRSDFAYALAFTLLMGISMLRMGNPQPFYYFQF